MLPGLKERDAVRPCWRLAEGTSSVTSPLASAARYSRRPSPAPRPRGGAFERAFALGIVRQLLEPALAAATASRRRQLCQGVAGQAVRSLQLLPAGEAGS